MLLAALSLFLTGLASAKEADTQPAGGTETIDVGFLRDTELNVVQKMLYSKAGRPEFGLHLGWMPFDPYTTTPVGAVTAGLHLKETLGVEVTAGGGYGLETATYKELEGPAYGVTPDAYRYLGEGLVALEWAPIYAKLNWMGTRVFHHDMFLILGGGATVEQALLPDATLAISPTGALGLGARVFVSKSSALRLQVRDDLLWEYRVKTESSHLKQNTGITVGWVIFGGGK